MKQLLKENIVLVAGIVLPLLLAGIFWVSKTISIAGIEPPVTSVVFITNYNESTESPWDVDVRDGRLHVVYAGVGDETKRYWQPPRLYIYNPVENSTREIDLPRFDKETQAKAQDIVPKEFETLSISEEQKSPDGYVFTRDDDGMSGYNRGFVTEMFGGGINRYSYVLKKDNYRRIVPQSDYNAKLIGWVVNE